MRVKRVELICLLVLIVSGSIFSQKIALKGKVRDVNTFQEIPNVNIFVKGTQIGTVSDVSGAYTLSIQKPFPEMVVVFRHIGYDVRELCLDSVITVSTIYLQPRIIPLQGVRVEASGERIYIKQDLPQAITVLKSQQFEGRGYTDAGDLLNLDHSVQVQEELSGKKSITIRGGTSDEVIVLYNDIKINSNFDNSFDLSLIDLVDVERIEVIKGSNTTLYGSGSLAGIINVVPKIQQDYSIHFQQRLGTYRSGNWSLQFYKNFNGLHASYSYKQGESKRQFSDAQTDYEILLNRASHHIAHILYHFHGDSKSVEKNALSGMFIRSSLNYENRKYLESLSNLNQIVSFKYRGSLFRLKEFHISGAYHYMDEAQRLFTSVEVPPKEIINRSYKFNIDKKLTYRNMDLLLSYQYEKANLDFKDALFLRYYLAGLRVVDLNRQHNSFAFVFKLHAPSGYDFMSALDFDLSMRHDRVHDQHREGARSLGIEDILSGATSDIVESNEWQETVAKFSTHLNGNRGDLTFSGYMNFGLNVKFPTLFEQVSCPVMENPYEEPPELNPEKSRSAEIGIEITKRVRNHYLLYGWQVSGNFFKNYYDNKLRMFYTPGIPVAVYDNVRDANITGLETKSCIYLFRKKITMEFGLSRYFISEKAAFPFKHEIKGTFGVRIDHAGYALQVHIFSESDQVGWIRHSSGGFVEVSLPGRTDIDLHISKTFELFGFTIMGSSSIRNVLNDDVVLTGLSMRDRRYYMTAGIKY